MLALTVALVGPYFIDWTSYRANFEREAGRILGREVKVEGTATARLLPFPSVTFTDVVVAGTVPGEPAVTVETFSMDAELAPFMRGDVHIFDMRLVRPSVLVDVAGDGTLDWAMRPSVPVGADHVSLEKLTVTDGRVAIRHAASGRTHRLTEIDAELSARSLAGPWRMEGTLRLDGMRTAMTVSTGALDVRDGMRLRLRAVPERYPVALETDGSARLEDGRAHYSGQFRLNTLSAGAQDGAASAAAYRLSGLFDFDHEVLAVEEFRFETGPLDDPYIAEGSAEFALGVEPRFVIRADGAQIRFEDAAGEAVAGGAALDQRLAAVREFLLDAPRPAIPGRIEVALPAIVAGDTTVRDVHLSAEPSETGWTVASLGATLPGRTTLEAGGELMVAEEELGFTGSLLLAVAQPSGFAAWLSRDVDDAIRRLPAAGFSAEVTLDEQRQTFRDLELMLGAAKFTGEIDSRTPAGEKPSMTLRLNGDRLDVEGMAAFASLFVSDSGKARLAGRDLEFEIAAGPVTAAGLTAETLDMALRLKDGDLEIDRLAIGGLAGANVSATGSLRDIGGTPSGTLDATVIATDLEPLVATLAARFPENAPAVALADRAAAYPGLLDDASVHLVAGRVADSAGLSLRVSGEAGGTGFDLAASLDDARSALAEAPLTLELSARNDDAAALYGLAGLPALPLGIAGGGELALSFDGAAGEGGWARLAFSGDGLDLSFEGSAALNEGQLSANGAVEIEADDLDPWLALGGVALPGFGLGLPVRLAAELDIDRGLLVLSGLGGEVADAAVNGDVNAQMRDGLPHLTGALSLAAFDLGAVAELAVGGAALDPAGSGWPAAPFAQAVSTPLTTDLDLAVERLRAGSFMEAADARFVLRIGREGVSLSDARARAFGGSLAGILDFRNDSGTGLLSGQLRLDGAEVEALLGDAGLSGTLDMTASLTANGKSVDGIVASLAGSGTAGVRDLAIAGVNPDAFPALIEAADAIGPQIDAQATRALAAGEVRDGVFRADGLDLAFTLANGTLRAPPARLETEGASLAADLRANLRAGTVGADALLTYDPGPEALVGSEPAVRLAASGPLDAVSVELDTAPLAQFLTQRALELEQRRVEAMQAALLERQRHRREIRYYAALDQQRVEAAEQARRAIEETDRLRRLLLRSDEDRLRREAEEERRRLELEAERLRIEEKTRLEAEEAERRAADERLRAEVEALLQARQALETAAEADMAEEASVEVPDVVSVTPEPAPRDEARQEQLDEPVHTGGTERSFSIEGILRAIQGDL